MADISKQYIIQYYTGILKRMPVSFKQNKEWNAAIVNELENGCLGRTGKVWCKEGENNHRTWAFEIPFAVKNCWEQRSKKKRPMPISPLAVYYKGGYTSFWLCVQGCDRRCDAAEFDTACTNDLWSIDGGQRTTGKERIGGIHGHRKGKPHWPH